jgi:hypothetical protein
MPKPRGERPPRFSGQKTPAPNRLFLTRCAGRGIIVAAMTYPPQPPLPVAPLYYGTPPRRGRPGLITAMGVMSIVVASLSGLASLWGVLGAFGMFMMSRLPAIPPPAPAPPAVQTTGSGGGTAVVGGMVVDPASAEDGLPEPHKSLVAEVLCRGKNVNEKRRRQIDLLLTVAGQKIFPFVRPGISPQTIEANISESGRLPSVSAAPGPYYFVVGSGRIEVYDDHALFRPDGSADVVSVTATEEAAPPSGQPSRPAPSGARRTSTVVMTGPGGTSTVTTATRAPMFRVNLVAAGLSMGEALLSLGVAIYLLVIGILTLRDSRSARRLHWVYVWVKIPLVILAVIAGAWMMSGLMNSMATLPNAPGGPPPPTAAWGNVMVVYAIIGGMVALAYPIALIFVLRSRTAREYYGGMV